MGRSVLIRVIRRLTGAEKMNESRVVFGAALTLAQSDKTDDEVRVMLQRKVAQCPKGTTHALAMLRSHRDSFEQDRAYRLLEAVVTDSPVSEVDPRSGELFRREQELGNMPIEDAVAYISALEPKLMDLKSSQARSDIGRLVGPRATHGDPLVRTQLSLSIVYHYISIEEGQISKGDKRESYFASPVKRVSQSG
jgi:hypothetical protein